MVQATLINHTGAREVTLNELAMIEAPPPTKTWYPIAHFDVYRTVAQTLQSAGYDVGKERFSVARDGHRFFGTLDLQNRITEGIGLAVGIRNSTDKSFPIGFCCGQRVFVCDNLAFTSEIVVSKKHTRFGQDRYLEGLSKAVASLGQYREAQGHWINRLRSARLSAEAADSLILRSYEEELIGPRLLPKVLGEWRKPSYEEFTDGSAWSLWNAFTSVLGRTTQATQPAKAALMTIRLQRLFSENAYVDVPQERRGLPALGEQPAGLETTGLDGSPD
ncbi:MAG: hypothetical protein KY476_14840 [Planctomycetes bacterium]|nr:hypothetical protein [Planctomycetota bacterium]